MISWGKESPIICCFEKSFHKIVCAQKELPANDFWRCLSLNISILSIASLLVQIAAIWFPSRGILRNHALLSAYLAGDSSWILLLPFAFFKCNARCFIFCEFLGLAATLLHSLAASEAATLKVTTFCFCTLWKSWRDQIMIKTKRSDKTNAIKCIETYGNMQSKLLKCQCRRH